MLPTTDKSQCCYESSGERCRYPGTMSLTTLGEGPWFCRWHFGCESGLFGERIVIESRNYRPLDARGYRHPDVERVTASAMHEAQESAARYCRANGLRTRQQMLDFVRTRTAGRPEKPRGLDWAQRILDRHAAGEAVASIALEMARRAIPREPGED